MPTMPTKRKPAVSSEDVVALLVSCIRNSNSGKIHWASVANDCSITANAAFKRYKKILENHDIPNAGSIDAGGTGGPSVAPKKGKGKGKAGPTVGGRVTKTQKTKKRKLQQDSEDEHPEEEEEQTGNLESLLDDDEDDYVHIGGEDQNEV